MKNLIAILVLLLLVGGAYFLITNNSGSPEEAAATETFTFRSNEKQITIQYDETGDKAFLTLDGERYELDRAISASGARYLSADEDIEYWEHQGTATVRIGGEVVFEGTQSTDTNPATRDPSQDTREELEGTTWQWKETQYNNDEIVTPDEPESFILSFLEEGRFTATTDCNGLSGNYTVTETSIDLGEIVSTKMFCEGSQEDIFKEMLSRSNDYIVTGEGELALMLEMDSGSVIFTPVSDTE